MLARFHLDAELLGPVGAQITLPPGCAHHAVQVLRMAVGDPLVLFDGQGGQWHARLLSLKPACAQLLAFAAEEVESPLSITLAQALPSADKMDWVLQKSVELGVAAIQPLFSQRSLLRLSGERQEKRSAHWRQVITAACAQCGRNRLPHLAAPITLPHYLAQCATQPGARWLLQRQGVTLRSLARPTVPWIMLAGPEGGFDEAECAAIAAAGFSPLSLGPRTLRAETAGPAALAAISALWE